MTRTFIPKRVHEAIGVFGAVSVATASSSRDSVASESRWRLVNAVNSHARY